MIFESILSLKAPKVIFIKSMIFFSFNKHLIKYFAYGLTFLHFKFNIKLFPADNVFNAV